MSSSSYATAALRSVPWRQATVAWIAVAVLSSAVALGGAGAVRVNVAENTADAIVLQYLIGDFTSTAVSIDGQPYGVIGLPREGQLLIAGAPELPHAARSVIIPADGQMTVSVKDASFYELENVYVAPSKGNLLRTVDPESVPYTFGPEYAADAYYPGQLASAGEPYVLRDYRGLVVDVFPFQYNPVRHSLRVYTDLTVIVSRVGPGGANVLRPSAVQRSLSLAFHDVYQAHFINYVPAERYVPLNETGPMLVICYDAWIANMQPFVDHKNSIGIPTTIVGVSTIGNNPTAIKAYIQNTYNATGLAFVLLVGDSAQIASPSAAGGASDPSYALLVGTDSYPEIMVGRFSAETPAQVDTQVLRSVEYETLQMTQQPWYHKATGIASAQGAGIGDDGEADYVHMDNIRNVLLGSGYTQVDQIYDTNGGTAAMVTAALNAGRGVINYCGHGSDTSWGTTGFSNSNVNALVNDNMLPFIFSVACVNGNFPNQTCFAEAWLRATHNGEPTGAVGAYMSSINQSWAPPMEAEDEFDFLLTDANQPYHSYGTLCYASSCAMMDQYGSDGANMYKTWHVFGDPSLRVLGTTIPPHGLRVTPADELVATGPYGGPFTPASIDYTVSNQGTTPFDFEVTATMPWITITGGTGTLEGGATAIVTVAFTPAANVLPNGHYTDTVAFANTTDHDGDATRGVSVQVGVPVARYTWDLSTDPGWTTEGQWAYGQPAGLGSHGKDPLGAHSGQNVYGYNLGGDYANNMPAYYLTTTAIDCSEVTDTQLRFWRWLGVEDARYDHAAVQVSNNGSDWTTLWSNPAGTGTSINDLSWSQMIFDISATADHQPVVYVRWGIGPTDDTVTYPGWNIDDIEIWGLVATPGLPGDLNCDGAVDFADINPFVLALTGQASYQAAFPNCRWLNGDVNGDGTISFADINPFVALLSSGH